MKKIYILFVIFFISGCQETPTVKDIRIAYINTHIDLPHSLDCWSLFSIDTIFLSQIRIKDPKITKPIYSIVESLKVDTTCQNVDVRITCLIRYNNDRIADTLCLGEKWGTVLNGVYVYDNEKLSKLIKKELQISND